MKHKIKVELDEFYYHEALDRTHMINEIIDATLISHPVFEQNKNMRKKIEKAQNILYSVYQDIAKISVEKFEKPDIK
jgi:hypothetical protein